MYLLEDPKSSCIAIQNWRAIMFTDRSFVFKRWKFMCDLRRGLSSTLCGMCSCVPVLSRPYPLDSLESLWQTNQGSSSVGNQHSERWSQVRHQTASPGRTSAQIPSSIPEPGFVTAVIEDNKDTWTSEWNPLVIFTFSQSPPLLGQGGQQNEGNQPGGDTENEIGPLWGGQPVFSCGRGIKKSLELPQI